MRNDIHNECSLNGGLLNTNEGSAHSMKKTLSIEKTIYIYIYDLTYGGIKMPVTISISDDVYGRLEALAVGFDTPERVIERLLDSVEESGSKSTGNKPALTFVPDEPAFKNELIARKKAQVVLHLKNGDRDVIHWNASRFQPSSNLRANLWSGILRNWKDKGIVSAELSVLPQGINHPDDNTDLLNSYRRRGSLDA